MIKIYDKDIKLMIAKLSHILYNNNNRYFLFLLKCLINKWGIRVVNLRLSRVRKNKCEKITTGNGSKYPNYQVAEETSHLDARDMVHYENELSHNNRPSDEELRGIFSKAVND